MTFVKQKSGCCSSGICAKSTCPVCDESAKEVSKKTLNVLLKQKSKEKLSNLEGFFYCKTPSCKVVYFRGEEILTQDDVDVVVGLKEGAKPATLCYCFDWSKEKIEEEIKKAGKTSALDDIKSKMKDIGCSCGVKNPSGDCCLGDVGKYIKEIL